MHLLGKWLLAFLATGTLGLSGCSWIGPHVQPREPGLDELVVYDPGTHERGLPAIEFNETEGGLQVEIPPAVHVHRFYYSGNKEFQGPLIPGGPTVVVANHPKTGKRMYIDTMLPAGAPAIAHDAHAITYIYPDRRVKVTFGQVFKNKASVKHLSGKGTARHYRDSSEKVKKYVHEHFRSSELYRKSCETVQCSGDVASGGAHAVGGFLSTTLSIASGALNIVPGVAALRGMGEQAAYERRNAAIRFAEDRKVEAESKYLPTLR